MFVQFCTIGLFSGEPLGYILIGECRSQEPASLTMLGRWESLVGGSSWQYLQARRCSNASDAVVKNRIKQRHPPSKPPTWIATNGPPPRAPPAQLEEPAALGRPKRPSSIPKSWAISERDRRTNRAAMQHREQREHANTVDSRMHRHGYPYSPDRPISHAPLPLIFAIR